MSGLESSEFGAVAAILAMAAATHFIRFAGYWLMARVPLTPRVRRMLDALPGSVVAATVLPIVIKSGPAAAIGMSVVVIMMILRRNEFFAVFVGVGVVALARAAGW
ncbi:MAG TPA: AzlD domain-containing protein [Xanthobacteraceae bacterium]|nr:AzlD domain-containing protein [Xanthobacteraceae bacterium]